MSYSVSGTMITLTRGDTFSALITITDLNDNQYINIFRTMVQSSAQSIHRVEHWLRLFQMTF